MNLAPSRLHAVLKMALEHLDAAESAVFADSPEGRRAEALCSADPEGYGGLERLEAAVSTVVADFRRRLATENLRGRQLTAAELEARSKPPPPLPPPAPPGYSYRPCRRCVDGVVKPGGARCACALAIGGHPGFELTAIPGAAPLIYLPEGRA